MILGIIYFIMAGVILALVIKNLTLSDKIYELKSEVRFWQDRFENTNLDLKEYKKIIENIKENLPF